MREIVLSLMLSNYEELADDIGDRNSGVKVIIIIKEMGSLALVKSEP